MTGLQKLRVVVGESSPQLGVRDALAIDRALEIAGTAGDAPRVVALTLRLRPDVVLLDARLSLGNVVEATRRIMTEAPTPIVLITDESDQRGIKLSMEALRAGALATTRLPPRIGTPEFGQGSSALVAVVRAMAGLKLVRRWRDRSLPASDESFASARKPLRPAVVAIGASTGGPAALYRILSELSRSFSVPILVTQHISLGFVRGMARWLDEATPLTVKVAEHGEDLRPGTVYVADDDRHLTVAGDRTIALTSDEVVEGHRPSASVLFRSAAAVFGPRTISVILTGMGNDGSAGLAAVRKAGGFVVAQDEDTSAVFGMPKAAISAGLADVVLPLEAIAGRLMSVAAL